MQEEGKNKRSISKRSTILLCLGFCFFVNPVPLGLDLIPDVFGCILIYFGLTQLAYFDGKLESARKSILYLLIVEFVKLLMMDMIYSTNISSNRMLGVTSFAIVQGIVYVMFFKQFFGGLGYYSMRNGCDETFKRYDGTAFLSYLSFFIRLLATVLPELLALVETELYFETDFDVMDSITALLGVKPVLVVLCSMISLVASVSWIVSMFGLLRVFHKEAGEDLDRKYYSEYTSRPEMVRPKKLRAGSFVFYTALVFSLDLVFDSIRVIPFSVMFILLPLGGWMLKDISSFKQTKLWAIPSFILMLGSEIFRMNFTSQGAIVIYETDLWIVGVCSALAVATAPICLICIRSFLAELRQLQQNLGGNPIETKNAWISCCVLVVLWASGFAVPYFYSFISTLRFFASVVFIYQTAKLIVQINDEEIQRFILYGKG